MTKQTNRKPGVSAAASATAPDAYTRITNRIVADLEQGVRPWCKPWGGDQLGARITRPRRANGKPYSGINSALIMVVRACGCGHLPRPLLAGCYDERPSPEPSPLAVSGERAEA